MCERYASARSIDALLLAAIPNADSFRHHAFERRARPIFFPLDFIIAIAALILSEIILRSCSASDA
jgi:hypothetical protein